MTEQQWPPTDACRIVAANGAWLRVDACNARYLASSAAGQKFRACWGGKARAQLRQAWEQACRWAQLEPDSDVTKELAGLALQAKKVRTPSAAVALLSQQVQEEAIAIEDEAGDVIAEVADV
eukprot:543359-Lingulodinium_polyedra.AAC.1